MTGIDGSLSQELCNCTYRYGININGNYTPLNVVEYGNARVVQDAVKFVSTKTPYYSVSLAGVSMGGVVCRYALAAAEQVGNSLPVSHFLSIDSPQQYATIDYDLMEFMFNDPMAANGITFEDYNRLEYKDRPSVLSYMCTKELLWANPAAWRVGSSVPPPVTKGDPISSDEHIKFYTRLNSLNTDESGVGSHGYPEKCRNLGVSFSSYSGFIASTSSADWLDINIEASGKMKLDYPWPFGSDTFEFNFNKTMSQMECSVNKRILFSGSKLPKHYTDTDIINSSYKNSDNFLLNMFTFSTSFYTHVWTKAINDPYNSGLSYQPTFIPFVSALDMYDSTNTDEKGNIKFYPMSTYLFDGRDIDSNDNSFLFSYAGNDNDNTQWNYNQDTGFYPQTTSKRVKVRSRFDEILFNRNHGQYGTDHDIFPVTFIDGVFNFINDKVTEDITTWNNTWKNKAVLTQDIDIINQNILYIKNGTNSTCIIDSDKGMFDIVNLNVKSGATVQIEDNTTLELFKSIHINFEPGSTLILGNNCKILLNNLSYFVINKGVNLELGESYDIKTSGYSARFIWN